MWSRLAAEYLRHCGSHRGRIRGHKLATGCVDRITYPGDIVADARSAHRRRFVDHQAPALAARGKYKHVRACGQCLLVLLVYATYVARLCGRPALEFVEDRTVADNPH